MADEDPEVNMADEDPDVIDVDLTDGGNRTLDELEPELDVIPWPAPDTRTEIDNTKKVFIEVDRDRVTVEVGELNDRRPWRSGSFYLLVFVVTAAVVVAVTKIAPAWAVVLGLGFALLFVLSIGVLQLTQDRRLGESGFLRVIAMILESLRLFKKPPKE